MKEIFFIFLDDLFLQLSVFGGVYISTWGWIFKRWIILFLVIAVPLLSGCNNYDIPSTKSLPNIISTQKVDITLQVSETLLPFSPTISRTMIPSLNPTKIRSQKITSTSIFIPIPTTNSPTFPYNYDLPVWISDPNTTIITALITDDIKKIRHLLFVNSTTGEKYEMQVPQKVGGFFWFDNSHFGFISIDKKTLYLIDTLNGDVSTHKTNEQETRFINLNSELFLAGLLVIREDNSNNDFYFMQAKNYPESTYSKNNTYFAMRNTGQPEYQIIVTDPRNGQEIWKTDPNNGIWNMEFEWSPTNNNLLAIIGGRPLPVDLIEISDMRLTIVDVREGNVVKSYKGNIGPIEWSHDSRYILYLNPEYFFRNYGIAFTDAPCILNVESGKSKCLTSIPYTHIPNQFSLMTTGIYHWMLDDKSIAYTYVYLSTDQAYKISGDLCIYDLTNGSINCPTDGIDALTGRSIISYDFSPGEKYVHFCYSASTILNDYADVANDGMISIDGRGFTNWTGYIMDGGPTTCSPEHVWRPLP